ncbi:uncharacterized protein MELLADRAFT_113335 [Melampsora larici-populina 98AG31]|uniref:FAD-binding FR-type domain-containing protein n=1 Tax=Melampsora larici-populina (strain 98AG31 / pathotype 3-4-7) TaxID=747676 RepID=F4S9J1_MELLP|nr:uncharacterized protein MELLADRAFT_113335 [Melampsora larici-populina 98AG31]EGF98647.1 hypothetical protein MELLADRAFT_113335 [Melampsora larici-populina 98AG31]
MTPLLMAASRLQSICIIHQSANNYLHCSWFVLNTSTFNHVSIFPLTCKAYLLRRLILDPGSSQHKIWREGCGLILEAILNQLIWRELQIERAYTNLNTICSNQSTWIEFLVKSYSDGEVSNYLKRFKSTDPNRLIEIRGPELNWCHPNDNLNEIVFIVGGTGITPVIQLLRRFYGPEQSHENLTHSIPKMKIIYLSKSKDAIYLNEELLKYSNLDSNLEIHKVITQPSCDNQSNVLVDKIGKLEINDLKKWIGMGSDQINRQRIILVCGPDSMVKAIAGSKGSDMVSQGELGGMLKELGYHQEEVYKL